MKLRARYLEQFLVLLVLLSFYIVFYIQIVIIDVEGDGEFGSLSLRHSNDNNNHNIVNSLHPRRDRIEPFGRPEIIINSIFNDEFYYYDTEGSAKASPTKSDTYSVQSITNTATNTASNNPSAGTSSQKPRRRVLVIAAAPRNQKHLVALWSSLECFTLDIDHVVVSAPTWGKSIIERLLYKAMTSIPRFASGEVSLDGTFSINDRYDVGLWCDALTYMKSSTSNNEGLSSYDEIGLLNDSVFALQAYTSILSSLQERNVSMTSLSYSLTHPNGYGPEHYWLESVWRGFDKTGIQIFMDYSCRPANDPLFCPKSFWGRKGCIVENFERAMSRQFPKEKSYGLFASDVPKDMLSWRQNFHSWVRHQSYWEKLVTEQNFPVSKVNWNGMIDSIDDLRLQTCTKFLSNNSDDNSRSTWLNGFDFSSVEDGLQ